MEADYFPQTLLCSVRSRSASPSFSPSLPPSLPPLHIPSRPKAESVMATSRSFTFMGGGVEGAKEGGREDEEAVASVVIRLRSRLSRCGDGDQKVVSCCI